MNNRLIAGRYELIEKTGEGGMAIVYKGKTGSLTVMWLSRS